jgi:hypothetical protein
MHSRSVPRTLARYAPLAAAILGSAAIAAPAHAQAVGGGGGGAVPTIRIAYNTSEINAAGMTPASATVARGNVTLSTGGFDGDPAVGEWGLNSMHNVLGLLPTGCWNTITPQMLPGDVVTVAGEAPITIPDITAQPPVVEGGSIVVRGTAGLGVDTTVLSVQLHPANAARFSTGSGGRQFLDSLRATGFSATFAMDPGSATNWTARFSGLNAGDFALATGSTAVVQWDPAANAAVHPAVSTLVDYEAGAVPGPVPGCPAPYAPNEAKSVSRSMINVANAGSDLTVTGVTQPGAGAAQVSLIDATGKTVSAPAIGTGRWTATVPASSLASLADGPIRIASAYSIGNGATVGGLLRKDTTAPAAPSASVASGAYTSAQRVALKSAEGTINYTTDGSAPTASSTAYGNPINVAGSQSIRAIAVDAAGNASEVAQFDYAINRPAVQQPSQKPVVTALPALKVESLTLTRRLTVRSARKHGFSAVVYAPGAAKVARIRVLRGTNVVQAIDRKVSRSGVIDLRMPTTRKARRSLKRGIYRIEIQVGQSATSLGTLMVRHVRLV